MAAKFVVFVAFLALANGMVRRDTGTDTWQDLEKHAAEFQKTFSEQFNALVNSQNADAVKHSLKEGSDSVLQQLSALSNSLQGALADANGKTKEVIGQAKQNIDKNVAELRKKHPEVEQQAAHLREKFEQAVNNAVSETQKLAKEVQTNAEETNQKIAPQVKKAYDDLVKNVQEIQKKVQEAASKQSA